jgi:hypothetical protein
MDVLTLIHAACYYCTMLRQGRTGRRPVEGQFLFLMLLYINAHPWLAKSMRNKRHADGTLGQ